MSVKVQMPIGEYTAPRCHLDEFFPGELTVSSDDQPNTVLRVFLVGEWEHGASYDDMGNVLAWFVSDSYKRHMAEIIKNANKTKVA